MTRRSGLSRKELLAAGALAVLLGLSTGLARAGECPADKVVAGSAGQQDQGLPAQKVTDEVRASIDLGGKRPELKNHLLRMRRLVVKPGGVVPFHKHDQRPANIYVLAGEITEYRTTCAVPITHKAGDFVSEYGEDIAHWWRNNSKRSAVLLSADLFHDTMGEDHPM